MKNRNGFIWLETLVSANIVALVLTTLIPIYITVKEEKRILHDRTMISLFLYDELQRELYLANGIHERKERYSVSNRNVTLTFQEKDGFLKGCVSWKNVKGRSEEICLYGLQK
ncbi:MAG: type II secretion system protein [Bacilli bacterium]|nr:type II secretion system protein [Bacilli bacterium]